MSARRESPDDDDTAAAAAAIGRRASDVAAATRFAPFFFTVPRGEPNLAAGAFDEFLVALINGTVVHLPLSLAGRPRQRKIGNAMAQRGGGMRPFSDNDFFPDARVARFLLLQELFLLNLCCDYVSLRIVGIDVYAFKIFRCAYKCLFIFVMLK